MLEFVRIVVTRNGLRKGRLVPVSPDKAARLVADGQAEYIPAQEVLHRGRSD